MTESVRKARKSRVDYQVLSDTVPKRVKVDTKSLENDLKRLREEYEAETKRFREEIQDVRETIKEYAKTKDVHGIVTIRLPNEIRKVFETQIDPRIRQIITEEIFPLSCKVDDIHLRQTVLTEAVVPLLPDDFMNWRRYSIREYDYDKLTKWLDVDFNIHKDYAFICLGITPDIGVAYPDLVSIHYSKATRLFHPEKCHAIGMTAVEGQCRSNIAYQAYMSLRVHMSV